MGLTEKFWYLCLVFKAKVKDCWWHFLLFRWKVFISNKWGGVCSFCFCDANSVWKYFFFVRFMIWKIVDSTSLFRMENRIISSICNFWWISPFITRYPSPWFLRFFSRKFSKTYGYSLGFFGTFSRLMFRKNQG